MENLRKKVDYVIVLYHGGKEHYRYPSPYLQKVCRRLVDKGADLVVCQHSHCIGCEEKYKSGTIVYGQGNFLFDDSTSEFWRTGLLIGLNDKFEISYYPIVKVDNTVRLADIIKSKKILCEFYNRSEMIKKPGFVEMEFSKFADNFKNLYLGIFFGKRMIVSRILNKLTRGFC